MTGWRWFKWLGVVVVVAALGLGAAVALAADASPFSSGSESGPTPQDDGERPWLGVFALPSHRVDGVALVWVAKDGPADQAGLERGDVITAVDGEPVTRLRELRSALADRLAGDTVTLTVIKGGATEPDGESSDVKVTLGTRPSHEEIRERFEERSEELGERFEGLWERTEEFRQELRERSQQRFDRFLGAEFSFLDDEGETVTVAIDAGEVKSVSAASLTVILNSGEDKTYTVGDDSHLPDDLAEGDQVVVVSVNGELKAVRRADGLGLFGAMGRFQSFSGLGQLLPSVFGEEAPEP